MQAAGGDVVLAFVLHHLPRGIRLRPGARHGKGQGKEDGITALQPILSRISAAFLFGECAGEFASSLQGKVPVTVVDTLDQAVPIAAQAAPADGAEEPVLLFSPAAASFDQFQNFEIRGEKFSELVTLLEGFCPTVGA